jgi:hypothetical protein
MKKCSLKKWYLLGIFAFLLSTMVRADDINHLDEGYEAAKGSGSCPTEGTYVPYHYDPWSFVKCNCTSYVAYRLRLNNVHDNNNVLFNNSWGNTVWGNGGTWNGTYNGVSKLTASGVHEDQYPAVGSVGNDTKNGHVAYVQRLWTRVADGRLEYIDLVEYNWPSDFLYHSRHILINGRGYPTSFLHFEEKGNDANTTNATCVTGIAPPSGAHAGQFCWVHNGSDASCGSASAYYYYDYQSCQKYTVNSQYCSGVGGSNRGYIIHIGDWFPEPIDPDHKGKGFATCDVAGGRAYGGVSSDQSITNFLLK